MIRRFPPTAFLSFALAAATVGCSSPLDRVRRLDSLHAPKDFAHVPDGMTTLNGCLKEIKALAEAEYVGSYDAAGAVFLLARVATEDTAALHRLHACRALGRLGVILQPEGDPPEGVPPTEGDANAALARLREIHGEDGIAAAGHADEATAAECATLLGRLADFRIPLVGDPGPVGYQRDLRSLRAALSGVMAVAPAEREEPGRSEADRALRSLAYQSLRTALCGTLLLDGDARVRAEASAAVAPFGGKDVARVLRTSFGMDFDIPARRAVVAAAGTMALRLSNPARDGAVTLLLAALDDDDRGIRFEARERLKALSGEDLGERPGPWLRWWSEARELP